ncbi:MAG: hypothetical protein ACR2QK_16585, partial [Acidimicrobiales bacterium]
PELMLTVQLSPYRDGLLYASALAGRGGEAAVDERLQVPPESSEQVLHPGAPAADLAVVDVERPPADGRVLADGTMGELLLRVWFGPQAAVGWGGDRYVVWESGPHTCVTVDLAADTSSDLAEMMGAAQRWADLRPEDRTVEPLDSVDRALLRVSGCY